MARYGSISQPRVWIGCSLLFAGLLAGVQGLDCGAQPFALPWENVTIMTYPIRYAAHRSIRWKVGSDEQVLAMQLGTTLNSTFIPDGDKVCLNDGTTDEPPGPFGCIFWRGGLFHPTTSRTWEKDKGTVPYNGSVSNDGWDYLHEDIYDKTDKDPLSGFPRGWDTVSFGNELNIPSYPMTIIDDGKFPFGAGFIGLASDSVFLESAVHANIAPSQSWGFDYGLTAADIPGELVVGGYNAAKTSPEDFHNFTVSPDKDKPCPLQVTVSGFKWGDKDLMNGQEPFMACVEPAYWSMIMPYKVQQNFNNSMLQGRNNTNFWRATWEYYFYNLTDSVPEGDFTIELSTGLSVTMPREEWIYDAVQINGQGSWDKIPGAIQATFGTAGYAPGVTPLLPFLGAPFLSQVYLVVDYSSNPQTFSLSKTKRNSDPPRLVKMGCNETTITPPPPQAPSFPAPQPKKKVKLAVIIGSAVGGFVVLVAAAGIIFALLRRRTRITTAETNVFSGTDPPKSDLAGETNMGFYHPPAYNSPGFSPTSQSTFQADSVVSDNNSIRAGYSIVPSSPPRSARGLYTTPMVSRRPTPGSLAAEGPPAELSARPPSAAFPSVFVEGSVDGSDSGNSPVQGSDQPHAS